MYLGALGEENILSSLDGVHKTVNTHKTTLKKGEFYCT